MNISFISVPQKDLHKYNEIFHVLYIRSDWWGNGGGMRKGRKSGPSTAGESRRLGWIPNSKIFINCTDSSAGAEKPPTPRIMRPQEYLSYFQRAANDFLRFGNRFDECRWYACVRPPPSWQNKSHREKPLKDANRFSREMGKSLIYKTKRENSKIGCGVDITLLIKKVKRKWKCW